MIQVIAQRFDRETSEEQFEILIPSTELQTENISGWKISIKFCARKRETVANDKQQVFVTFFRL